MTDPRAPLSRLELVALLAMLSATVAYSIDAMLPVLPDISAELVSRGTNDAQLVIGAFILGMGLGTFFTGPLSDAYGRKPIAVGGAAIYTLAAISAAWAQSLEALLVARFVQGIGAAGPRVMAVAIVRDLFRGRAMAQIMSYVIFVFTLVPILAPSIGWAIAWAFGWRAVFYSFAVFSLLSIVWLVIRQPETLAPEAQRPFRPGKLLDGTREVLTNRHVIVAMIVQTLIFAILFASLMSSQQVFDEVLGAGDSFPLWFGLMGLLASFANLINARIVVRLGMREVVRRALLVHGVLTLVFLVAQITDLLPAGWVFPVAFLWMTANFYLAGFGIGNMNALALEPMGHMAGLAASIITALATIGSAVLAAPIGLAFNGTMVPLSLGVLVLGALGFALLHLIEDTGPMDD